MRRSDNSPGEIVDAADAATWPGRLAKIRVGSLSKGTGWAFGTCGVLTGYDVILPLLQPGEQDASPSDSAVRAGAEIVLGASTGRSFQARLLWSSRDHGLAILQVVEANRLTWETVLRSTPDVPLAFPGSGRVDNVLLYGLPAKTSTSESSTVAWMLAAPLHSWGALVPGPARGSTAVLDIARDSLPRSARKHPMPGAVVLSGEADATVLGVVNTKPRGRQTRRFDVATIPDDASDAALQEALRAVGSGPVIHLHGPSYRAAVLPEALGRDLLPRHVDTIKDIGWFGTRRARSDISLDDEPHFSWIGRPERAQFAAAIDAAIAGTGPRVLLLHGPSAAGKSRLAAEVLPSHPGLAGYRMIAPRVGGRGPLRLPDDLWPDRALLWLDNMDRFPATTVRHDSLRLLLQNRPGLIVVGTVLLPPHSAEGGRLVDSGSARSSASRRHDVPLPLSPSHLSPVQALIDDEALVATIAVAAKPRWSTKASDRSAWAVARAKKYGLGLGEYLSSYRELAGHYTAASWPTRALVDLVADWSRSGVGEALPLTTARSLWEKLTPVQLPRDEVRAFTSLDTAARNRQFTAAVNYACEALFDSEPLVLDTPDGLVASEFARVHIDRGVVDAQLWDYLLSTHPTTPAQRLELGIRALGSGTPQRALRAFESVLYFRDDDAIADDARLLIEVLARRGIALYHAQAGRHEQAVMVLTDLVDTFADSTDDDVAEQTAQALLGIGLTFSQLDSIGQAASAYGELVQRYRSRPSPVFRPLLAMALLGQASAFAELGRLDEERAAYRDLISRFADDPGPSMAMMVDIARAGLAAPVANGNTDP